MCNDEKQVARAQVGDALPTAITGTDIRGFKAAVEFLEKHRKWLKSELQQVEAIPPGLIQALFVVDVIISDPKNKGKCTVDPMVLRGVEPGERLVFRNLTGNTVTVTFDCGGVVKPSHLKIKGGAIGWVFVAKEVEPRPFVCKYSVDCTGGGAGPTMIIEDPDTG